MTGVKLAPHIQKPKVLLRILFALQVVLQFLIRCFMIFCGATEKVGISFIFKMQFF